MNLHRTLPLHMDTHTHTTCWLAPVLCELISGLVNFSLECIVCVCSVDSIDAFHNYCFHWSTPGVLNLLQLLNCLKISKDYLFKRLKNTTWHKKGQNTVSNKRQNFPIFHTLCFQQASLPAIMKPNLLRWGSHSLYAYWLILAWGWLPPHFSFCVAASEYYLTESGSTHLFGDI